MMGANLDNLDSIFKKQLRDLSQDAPKEVWSNIENVLDSHKKARRLVFYKAAAAVAALALIGSGFLYFANQSVKENNNIAVVEKQTNQGSIQDVVVTNNNTIKQEVKPSDKAEENVQVNENQRLIAKADIAETNVDRVISTPVAQDNKVTTEKMEKLRQKEISLPAPKIVAGIVDTRKLKVQSILNSLPDIYSNSYAVNNLNEEEAKHINKWMIGGEFSPLYSYRNITETTGGYSKDFYNSAEKAVMSYTGGLNLQYKAIDRLTIQAGVYYTTMGQSLDYMSVYANTAYNLVDEEYKGRFVSAYSINNSAGDVSFNSQYVIVDDKSARVENHTNNKAVADVSDPIYNNLDAEIQQNFQYVEVPLLMRYKIIDKDVDVNIVGGFGANFLVGNDVYLKYAGNKEVIGKTDGVNTVNYNSTLGFGIEYPIMERIHIRLEPSVKYYLNEINSSSSAKSHPYSVGIYTGINYSF